MRRNKTVVLGAAALCVGMLGFAGCNNQVMGKRDYVPATDTAVAPMPESETTAPQPLPAPAQPAPAAQKSGSYQPMAAVASAPVTSVSGKSAVSGAGHTHVVKSGDTIGKIANQYGVSVAAVMQANGLDEAKARRIQVGRKLTIPGGSGHAVSASGKSAAKSTGKAAPAAAVKGVAGGVGSDGTYTVQPGDFPGKIARKLNVKESDLMKANNLTADAAKRLKVGQKLVVPGKGGAAVAAKGVTAAPKTPAATGTAPVALEKDPLADVLVDSEVIVPTPGVNPAAGKVDTVSVEEKIVLPALSSVPAIVEVDTTLTDFAAKHNVSADKIRELNPGLIPADGKLTKDLLLMIPGN